MTWSLAKSLTLSTFRGIGQDDVPTQAAAMAYYTVFSLPPLLVLLVAVAGTVFGPEAVTELLIGGAASTIGPGVGEEIEGMIEAASSTGTGLGAKLASVLAVLVGATGAFGHLQKALNRAWNVEVTSGGGLVGLLAKRLLSFGMVLAIVLTLVASLVLTSVLSSAGTAAASLAGGGLADLGVQVLNVVGSLAVVAGLFAVLFRYLPDAEIAWPDVWVGAAVTAVLFTIGKTALGVYLGHASPGSAFGAAGSLALLLVWIYYSALIVLVGAEFTQAWALQVGQGIEPEGSEAEDGPPSPVHEGTTEGAPIHPLAEPRDPAPY